MLSADQQASKLNQGALKAKIRAYLHSENRPESFIRQFETGYCSGISSLWLYSKSLQNQPNPDNTPRDDYEWFKSTTELISHWEEPAEEDRSLLQQHNALPYRERTAFIERLERADSQKAARLKKIVNNNQEMERFISQIQYFQHVDSYFATHQGDLNNSLEDTKGKTLNKEYSIASLFTLPQLQQLLNTQGIIQDGKQILISSHGHDISVFRKDNEYYCFDPNSASGEVVRSTPNKVGEFIFKAMGFDENRPSPLGFRMFSFDRAPGNYPNQRSILESINPSLNAVDGYAKGNTGLHLAAWVGSLASAQYLLDKGADPNQANKNGVTVLHRASANGYADIVSALLADKRCSVNAQDEEGRTALMAAAKGGNMNVVTMLLADSRVDCRMISNNNNTAFTYAARDDRHEIVEYFLQKGIYADHRELSNAAFAASQAGHKDIQLFINKHLEQYNKFVAEFRTAVSNNNYSGIVRYLENSANNFPIKQEPGLTQALQWAIENNYHVATKKMLSSVRAEITRDKEEEKKPKSLLHKLLVFIGVREDIREKITKEEKVVNEAESFIKSKEDEIAKASVEVQSNTVVSSEPFIESTITRERRRPSDTVSVTETTERSKIPSVTGGNTGVLLRSAILRELLTTDIAQDRLATDEAREKLVDKGIKLYNGLDESMDHEAKLRIVKNVIKMDIERKNIKHTQRDEGYHQQRKTVNSPEIPEPTSRLGLG